VHLLVIIQGRRDLLALQNPPVLLQVPNAFAVLLSISNFHSVRCRFLSDDLPNRHCSSLECSSSTRIPPTQPNPHFYLLPSSHYLTTELNVLREGNRALNTPI
jgi:hypothetical protein